MSLKSGEDIITDVKEMRIGDDEDGKIVGYFLTNLVLLR